MRKSLLTAVCILFATGVFAQEKKTKLFFEVGFGSTEVFNNFGSFPANLPNEQSAKTAMNVDLGIGLSFNDAFFVKLDLLTTGSTLYPSVPGSSTMLIPIIAIKENTNLMYTNIEIGTIYKIGSLSIKPAVNIGLVAFSNKFTYNRINTSNSMIETMDYKNTSYGFGGGFSITADYKLNKYLSVFAKGAIMGTSAPDTELNEELSPLAYGYKDIDKDPVTMISTSIGMRCNF